jgi:hypothetical protein
LQQALQLALAGHAVGFVHVGALGLLTHGMHLERQDGQPVDHAARGFAVQPRASRHGGDRRVGACRSRVHQAQGNQQQFVDPLGGIVASLVVAVDGPLVGGDLGIGHGGAARQIFFGPQQAVVAVVGLHPDTHLAAHGFRLAGGPAFQRQQPVVQGRDGGGMGQGFGLHPWLSLRLAESPAIISCP